LTYPEMTAQLRSESSSSNRRIRIGANVSGFILELDSSIPDYVFSLVDVYRQGKERVERLTSQTPRSPLVEEMRPKVETHATETQRSSLSVSNILISLIFLSGQVRIHSGPGNSLTRLKALRTACTWHRASKPSTYLSSLSGPSTVLPIITNFTLRKRCAAFYFDIEVHHSFQ